MFERISRLIKYSRKTASPLLMSAAPRLQALSSLCGILLGITLLVSHQSQAIEVHLKSLSSDILEDAVLIAGTIGQCPVNAIALGDIDLATSSHTVQTEVDSELGSWWLVGHINGEVAYTSNLDLTNADLYGFQPLDAPDASSRWPAASIIADLASYNAGVVKFSFGVMADTHYYSEPLGTPHPIQQAEPAKFNLSGNIDKMAAALDTFAEEEVSFATLLGDMVEDHKSYPTINSFIPSGALATNTQGLQNLFDKYAFPIRLAIGNHDQDLGEGTSRTDLIENLTYYAQESYDANDSASRMDYVFDIQGIRFIVYDNVNELPGANRGFRSASVATQSFLQNELAKISNGGTDEGQPVIIMAHARVDCLAQNGCGQKIDLIGGNYQWTTSIGGNNEYYLESAGGGAPGLPEAEHFNQFVWLDNAGAPVGSIGTLDPGQWNYGRNNADPIAFDTLYVRLDSQVAGVSWDPDNAAPEHLQYKVVSPGAAENFEEIRELFDTANSNGANILAVLQGHNHTNDYNIVSGIEYFSFKSLKVVPMAHAIVEILHDNSLYIRGFGEQETYKFRTPKEQYYDCGDAGPNAFSELWAQLLENHDSHALTNRTPGKLWRFGSTGVELGTLDVDMRSSGIVYEDAEDGRVDDWRLFDANPSGATVNIVFDQQLQSNTIEFDGAGWTNGYELKNADLTDWRNTSALVTDWKMKFDDTFIVSVKVDTTIGNRFLRYTAANGDDLGNGSTVSFGLGSSSKDGQWVRVIRDLQADLALAQPGVKILSVQSLRIRGNGRLDDVKLHRHLPPIDTDGDGISDVDESAIYGTNAAEFDSDGDGVSDFGELNFWGTNWNTDYDNDGLVNLLDIDADGDGIADGVEIALGLDPSDAGSIPATIYEDAEDEAILGWEVFDNNPAGASIQNVFDDDRQSRVIELSGSSWTNGYRLGKDESSSWENTQQFFSQWSMNYAEHYIVVFKVATTAGTRYLRYEPLNNHGLGSGLTVLLGLGSATKDGQWHTYTRDLQADLSLAEQPGVFITAVKGVHFRGSGRVDDIQLHSTLPDGTDSDGDGLSDADEVLTYGTNANLVDTDGDGIDDGTELLYWAENWNVDFDGDALGALLDDDADGDSFTDGAEIDAGSDPSDSASYPATVYEDAEDGTILGWDIIDSDPVGAQINNVFDLERFSRVIELSGTNWRNSYRLANEDGSNWNNTKEFVAKWSLKYGELYIVTIKVATTAGSRYLRYEPVNSNGLGSQRRVDFGLGSATSDGQWHSFSRDLQADLSLAQPGVTITAVNYILIRGSGRIDDIGLSQ